MNRFLNLLFGRKSKPAPHRKPQAVRRQASLAVEALEGRTLLTTTLYLDFGDRFTGANGLTRDGTNAATEANLINIVNGPDFNGEVAGTATLAFTSFAAEAIAPGRLTAQQAADMRRDIIALVRRAYQPFEVDVVELTANTTPRAAATLNEIRATLDSNNGQAEHNDAYVLIAGVTPSGTTAWDGYASDIDTNGTNTADQTAVVLANNIWANGTATAARGATAFAYVAAHEAAHTFGLEHTVNATTAPTDTRLLTASDMISQFNATAGLLDPAMDQRANLNVFTRFPLPTAHNPGTQNSYDELSNDP